MDRLDKFLCDSGVGTRSQVKVILKAGRVTVDGRVERDNSRKIDPAVQVITLDGTYTGTAKGITESGSLLVESDAGDVREVLAADVSVRGIMGYV